MPRESKIPTDMLLRPTPKYENWGDSVKDFKQNQAMSFDEGLQSRRFDTFQGNQSKWRANKMNDQDYLSSIDELIGQSGGFEKKSYQDLLEIEEGSMLENKLNNQYLGFMGKALEGKINQQDIFNKLTELAVIADNAGLENFGAAMHYKAGLAYQQFKNGVGSGDDNYFNDIMGGAMDITGFTF